MSAPPHVDPFGDTRESVFESVARNVGTRYLVILVDGAIGLVLLPFNVHHLGQAAWGLWMLTASLNAYFSVLDLGYGGSITRFVALYRARRDVRGLNEIVSTLACLFTVLGLLAYGVFVTVAFNFSALFNVGPDQAETGRDLLLLSGLFVCLGFPFSVFGGVMNGFQRYDLNNVVAIATSALVALTNVALLLAGRSLVELVAATTAIRIAAYFVYRFNAYRVFPALSIRFSHVRASRLREVTGFSIYISIIDWSNKLNYSVDAVVIGAFLSPAAVALWTVPRRIAEFLQQLTNQLNGVLLPIIVDSGTTSHDARLRTVLVQGTKLSLFAVVPVAAAVFMLSGPLIHAWVGPAFDKSAPITQVLVAVIAVRVGNATATTVLKGAGQHKLLAMTNLGTALANLALSLLWIRRYGLMGQAFGTLIPVTGAALFVLWPAACRRVGIGVADAIRTAVWPATWPLAVMVAVVLPIRAVLPAHLWSVALAAAVGCAAYAIAFVTLALSPAERLAYLTKAGDLTKWRRAVAAA
jgi:O-antigen/teichoic acid export membrane protein